MPFLLAFAIGIVAGLRSMTAPAAASWAIRLGWWNLREPPLMYLGSPLAAIAFLLFALAELVADKLPTTPSRLSAVPLTARILMGGLSGGALLAAAGQSGLLGAVLGGVGGIAGAFLGYHVRRALTASKQVPDFVIALIEDVIAVGGAILIVSNV
jgi:uncharacterized membrane protein